MMKIEDGYGDTLDDLTGEELQSLKDEGLLPQDFEPGMSSQEFQPGPAESGGSLPAPALPDEEEAQGGLSAVMSGADAAAGGASVEEGGLNAIMPGAMAASGLPEGGAAEVPPAVAGKANIRAVTAPNPDPMAQRFNEIALNWLPTSDKDMKTARAQAEAAAHQLSALRAAAEAKAQEFPWAEFGGAMLSGGSPRFMQQLGTATLAAEKVRREREANAQKMGLEDVGSQFGGAKELENATEQRVRTGAELAQAAARTQHYANMTANNPANIGRSDAVYIQTVHDNPGLDPASPEFTQKLADARAKVGTDKQAIAATKAATAKEAADARTANTRSNMDYKAKLTREAQAARDSTDALSPDTVKMLSQQAWTGDKSGITGFGRNKRARAQIAEGIQVEGQRLGKSGADLAAMNSEFVGITAGQRTAGTRSAQLGFAINELENFIPQAVDASSKVERTGFTPINKLYRMATNTWSPEQRVFNAANQAVLNAYAGVIARGGITVHSQEQASDMLSTADTHAQYVATVNQLMREARAAKLAPEAVRQELKNALTTKPADTTGAWKVIR